MDDAKLAEIEREVAVGWTLPGRADAYALNTITALVAEVRRLRRDLDTCIHDCRKVSAEWETATDLLEAVEATFDGADPVGPPLRDEIRAFLND